MPDLEELGARPHIYYKRLWANLPCLSFLIYETRGFGWIIFSILLHWNSMLLTLYSLVVGTY